jgi:metal-dependent amidase/aminoacylase/carboxypeptidase family protein
VLAWFDVSLEIAILDSRARAGELVKHGFKVEMGVLGMPTAFKAIKKVNGKGPKIAFLCEYDALLVLGTAADTI